MGFAFLGLDINDSDKQVDHIDGQKTNNCINNLRLVTNQQNSFNRTTAKGFHFDKQRQKYKAQIRLNGKDIHLGYFSTEAEARASYLSAKLVYHKIN